MLGLSTGLTLASVSRYPARRIDVVEPEPAVAQAAGLFDSYTRNVLGDSRVHLIFGDGRNHLLVVPQQYDVVISEASDMWVAGAGSEASREFYRIAGARLNPGGIFAQSIHTQGLLPDDLGLSHGYVSLRVSPHADLDFRSRQFDFLGYARLGGLELYSLAKPLR